jgi:hypothetical protein
VFTAWVRSCFQPRAARGGALAYGPARGGVPAGGLVRRVARAWLLGLACVLAGAVGPARADGLDLMALTLARSEQGLFLDYQARLELPRAVEDALQKGVPLYFQARAEVFRKRWYWRDDRIARATRSWRLTWQPLTRRYRVNFGSLSQNYDNLYDALGAIQRATRWRLADPEALADGADYVAFDLRLDTSQLPRPLQIGLGGEADWDLAVERRLTVPAVTPAAAAEPPPPAPVAAGSEPASAASR